MATKKNVYAVKRGRTTGLFMTWAQCKEQVAGYPGAVFKGFTNAQEAEAWLHGAGAARTLTPGRAVKRRTGASQLELFPPAPEREPDYVIYTDGSCLRNPDGPGGWAVVLREVATGEVRELSGGEPSTTNNRMELMAAIMALRAAREGAVVELYTDSRYLQQAFTRHWLPAWKRRGWRKADGQPVKNQDLWQELDRLFAAHTVQFRWVKGHVGVDANERCDRLAKAQAMRYR